MIDIIGLYNYFDSKQLTTWMHVVAFAVGLVSLVNLQYHRPNLTNSHAYRVSMYLRI